MTTRTSLQAGDSVTITATACQRIAQESGHRGLTIDNDFYWLITERNELTTVRYQIELTYDEKYLIGWINPRDIIYSHISTSRSTFDGVSPIPSYLRPKEPQTYDSRNIRRLQRIK